MARDGSPRTRSRAAGLAVLAAAAAGAFAPAPSTGAEAGGPLDLSALAARVAAGVSETEDGDPKVHRTYVRLGKSLARADAPGLADDFHRATKVSKACGGVLSGDAVLRDALDDVLDEGDEALRAADTDVVVRSGLLDAETDRAKVLALASKARTSSEAARTVRAGGDEAEALRLAVRAARGFRKAGQTADRLRDRQNRAAARWSVPLSGRGGALLSVWGEPGPSPRLYAVGAHDTDGPQFLVLQGAGEAWVRIPMAGSGDLWWVNGIPGDGVWASGTEGTVVHYDPATGAFEDRSTGVDATLYGLWGTGATDVWAVGGDPDGVGPRPVLLHWDGEEWTPAPVPVEAANRMIYKVWGTATDDVWACGQGGVILHFDGDAWTWQDSGTLGTLLTIQGDSPTVAVGGGGVSAIIAERGDDGVWTEPPFTGVNPGGGGAQTPGGTPSLNGVWVPDEGTPLAVGNSRTVLRRISRGWEALPGVPSGARDLHAVWIDDEGNAVMVGGSLSPLTNGVLVAYGRRTIPGGVYTQAKLRGGVQDFLYLSCALAGCHLAPSANHDLDFATAENTRSLNLGVPSAESPLLRVVPGRPSQSYLLHKIAGTQGTVGGSGDRMPLEGAFLTQEQEDAVRAWILEGARDN